MDKPSPFTIKLTLTNPVIPDLNAKLAAVIEAVLTAQDKNGQVSTLTCRQLLSEIFQQLPNKLEYPDYYDIIQNPVALSTLKVSASLNFRTK